MKKKLFTIALTAILLLCLLSGCGASAQKDTIHIGCMKGPTAIGMIQLLSEADAGKSIKFLRCFDCRNG